MTKPNNGTMAFGVIVFVATLAAWLYASSNGIPSEMLWAVSTPVVLGLFVGQQLAHTSEQAQKAADATNGALPERIKAAVTSALADRDAARTRQSRGDISLDDKDTINDVR